MVAPDSYQRLGFVEQTAERTTEVASDLYSKAKAKAPPAVAARLTTAEQKVASTAAPYIAKAQDVGTTLLKSADAKVDAALNEAGRVYSENAQFLQEQLEKQKQFHAQNIDAYRSARDEYLKKVEQAVEFIKTNGLTGAARAAADEVLVQVAKARQLPNYLLQRVEAAWQRLLDLPPVRSAADASLAVYSVVHDRVTATSAYKGAYDLAQATLERGTRTWAWRTAAPYLQPALNTAADTRIYELVVAELQPKQA